RSAATNGAQSHRRLRQRKVDAAPVSKRFGDDQRWHDRMRQRATRGEPFAQRLWQAREGFATQSRNSIPAFLPVSSSVSDRKYHRGADARAAHAAEESRNRGL